ncbi:MAG: outer membrane beta-barrel protein [Candidatus Omnitrophica bacterium]|nr:outer membrane beta-barrel protein [Candidatus Omnitrophota bacterium]
MNTISLVLAVSFLMCWHGLGHADFKWNLEGDAAESYDDNITFTKDDRLTDAITRISLGGGFTREGKNDKIDFRGRLTENIFARHSSFTNLSQDLALDAVKDLTPSDKIEVHDKFRHAEDPAGFEDNFGRAGGRYSTYTNHLNLSWARQVTRQWTTKFKYLQSNYDFTRSDLSDAAKYSPGISGEYAIDSATQVLMGYDYTRWIFDPGNDTDIHTLSGGLRRYLTNQLYAELKPGVDFINSVGRDLTKPRYEASLTDDVDENTKLKLTYIKEYAPTAFSQDIFNNWRLSASIFKQLNSRVKTNISAFYGQGRYLSSEIMDKSSGVNLGLEYALNERASAYCGYTYERANSNSDARTYRRNVFTFGIKFAF